MRWKTKSQIKSSIFKSNPMQPLSNQLKSSHHILMTQIFESLLIWTQLCYPVTVARVLKSLFVCDANVTLTLRSIFVIISMSLSRMCWTSLKPSSHHPNQSPNRRCLNTWLTWSCWRSYIHQRLKYWSINWHQLSKCFIGCY